MRAYAGLAPLQSPLLGRLRTIRFWRGLAKCRLSASDDVKDTSLTCDMIAGLNWKECPVARSFSIGLDIAKPVFQAHNV